MKSRVRLAVPLRDYDLLSIVFAKTPIFEGHDYFSEATSEITLRVHVCIVCLIACILSLIF